MKCAVGLTFPSRGHAPASRVMPLMSNVIKTHDGLGLVLRLSAEKLESRGHGSGPQIL